MSDFTELDKAPEFMTQIDEPIKPIANDGIYPRCVWCGGEIYALAVIAYSKAENPCLLCGKFVPEEYVR